MLLAANTTIKKRGYRRCSSNKHNFAFLANHPDRYLEKVKEVLSWYLEGVYIGYVLSGRISKQVIESIYHSIAILENGNISDVRPFMTAAVITGYVFNSMPSQLEYMRPLDDYDIIRFWMMFLTMKQFNIKRVYHILSEKKKQILFGNVKIYLPSVNGLSLNVNDVTVLMQNTSFLSQPPVTLPENKSTYEEEIN